MSEAAQLPASIPLNVSRLPSGRLRVESPAAPGFAAAAGNPYELARAVDHVMREAACANYAVGRGYSYDVEALDPVPAPREPRRYPPSHDPAAWSPLPGGTTWRSPGGRTYRDNSQTVARVKVARLALGLSNDPPS